jgi:uncharacterized protein (DUF58 family)
MKWLLGTIVLLVVGLIFKLGLLVYGMYTLLGVLLVSRSLAWNWTGRLAASRSCEQHSVQIGESASIEVTVRNLGPVSVPWVLLEDALPFEGLRQHPPRLRIEGSALSVERIKARGETTLSYEAQFLMRGYYQFGPLLLESGDLFGLHRRYRVVTSPHYVLVYPKLVPLEGYDIASKKPIGEVRISHRLFEDPTRIAGVRPYQKGDPLNRIHWRATARTGLLHSKVYEPSCIAGATLVLDFHAASFEVKTALARAELTITTAASLANAIYQMGEQVGLVTNGRDAAERVRYEGWRQEFRTRALAKTETHTRQCSERLQPLMVETQRGPSQLDRILRTLARLELTDGFTLPGLLAESASRLPRDASVIAILTSVSEEAAIALGNLRRNGYAVTAVMVMFGGESEYYDWAEAPEWAGRLLAEHIDFRRVDDEASLSRLCAEHILR